MFLEQFNQLNNIHQSSESILALEKFLSDVQRVWTKDPEIQEEESVLDHTRESIELARKYSHIIEQYGWNPLRVVHLLEVHDIPEILTGDTDPRRIDAHVKHVREEWAMTLLISNPSDREAWQEYAEGESIDAQFAKAFDKMQFLLKLQKIGWRSEYPWAMRNYRKYFLPFPELLEIVDHPIFSTIVSSESTTI